MTIVYSGNPLNGTAGNDFLIDFPTNAPNNTLSGLAGNDVLIADQDYFFSTAGNSIGTAEDLTATNFPWSTAANSEIASSTGTPHATAVYSATVAGQAYYSVAVLAGQTITLDTDFSFAGTDTFIELLAPGGATVVASSDDNSSDVGSITNRDSLLTYTFLSSGTFLIRVREFGGDGNFEVGDGFVLNVSLTGHAVTNAEPVFGNDILIGGTGIDYMSGQAGTDTFQFAAGDVVSGEYYNGGSGIDTLQASAGSNYNHDFSQSTVLSIEKVTYFDPGIGGTATIRFGAAQVGAGLASNAAIAFTGFGDVTDTLAFTMGSATSISLSNLIFTGVGGTDRVVIDGDVSSETMVGSTIRDVMNGGDGDDMLIGGLGADTMNGGTGLDTFFVDNAADVVNEIAGGGALDKVFTTVSYTLVAGVDVELMQTTNAALTTAINLVGNAVSQTLIGNAGANNLIGGGGNDTLRGLGGNDNYFVDSQSDIIEEVGGGGALDRVYTTATYVLSADDNIEFMATTNAALTTAINLAGNALNQTIVGNAGSNVIYGGLGNDNLQGLGGADFFVFNTAPGAGNIDTLDFTVADTIRMENSVYTGLTGIGALTADQFVSNTSGLATTATQHIIYESDTGNLSYDSNGNAAGGSVVFAHLAAGLAVTSADFFIV